MIKKIKAYSPIDIYVLFSIYILTLFLNFSEFFSSRVTFSYIFEIRRSIVYGLIRGVGDEHVRHDGAIILYWVILLTSLLLITLKAKKISDWLWAK